MKIPGICANLEEAWEEPYEVCKVLSGVNYRVRRSERSGLGKVVHINNLKNVGIFFLFNSQYFIYNLTRHFDFLPKSSSGVN